MSHDDETSLTVDDRRSGATIPELEAVGGRRAPDYAVRAERLDGDLWEVWAAAL